MDLDSKLADDFDEEEVFYRATQISDPQKRNEYLSEVCPTPQQLVLIKNLLAQDDTADFLETPAVVLASPAPIAPGMQLGWYKIEKQIGAGGFGDVFVASQVEPVKRTVAIKILRQSSNATIGIADRFKLEQQTLAGLEHPNIARLIDAGVTCGGLPFFVMEFIDGIPLDQFLKANDIELDQRLSIFHSICDAVSHAHQKGVVHRDLKPGNILVSQQDEVIETKVIDFGIAKLTTLPAVEQPTLDGQVLGTPGYMSPEQVQSGSLIDTRADVYGLGAILYFMVTGKSPLKAITGDSGNLHDAFRTVIEIDPPPPTSLSPKLPPEVDWIAGKAIRKLPEDRYASVSDLAADVSRFRRGEAVSVGPPTVWYQTSKWIRRHRLAAVAMAAVASSIIVGAIIACYGLYQAKQSLAAEKAATNRAQLERDHATQVGLLLGELAGASNVENNRPFDFPVRQLLHEFADNLDTKLATQPEVELELRHILGRSFFSYGDALAAAKNLERCRELCGQVDADASLCAAIDLDLGRSLIGVSRFNEAKQLVESALESGKLDIRGESYGYHALSELARQLESSKSALVNCQKAFAKANEIRDQDPSLAARMQSYYARALFVTGHREMAEEESVAALETIESLPDTRDVDVAVVQRNRAMIVRRTDLKEAARLIQSARNLDENNVGPSERLVSDLVVESDLFRQGGRMRQATRTAMEATEIADKLQSSRGSARMLAYQNAGSLLENYDDRMALDAWKKSCELTTEILGDSDRTVRTLLHAARLAETLGEHAEAERWLEEALAIMQRSKFGRVERGSLLYSLACVKIQLGKFAEAKSSQARLAESREFDLVKIIEAKLALANDDLQAAESLVAELNENDFNAARRLAMEVLILKAEVAVRAKNWDIAKELVAKLRNRSSARRGPERSYAKQIEDLMRRMSSHR